jgi:hypothetical protein
MYQLSKPAEVFVFLASALINGSIAYYCWVVIQRYFKGLRSSKQSKVETERSRLWAVVMFFPLLGFSFEFFYFLYKTLQMLWSLL